MAGKLKIVICDENESDRGCIREVIEEVLKRRNVRFAVQTFDSGEQLLKKKVDLSHYDVIFLDANMRKLNGIETAYQIRKKGWDIKIILLAEMIDYAVDGYRIGALRYVMKDNMKKELPECLDFILKDCIDDGREMAFPLIGGERNVMLSEILYIESRLHKLYFKFAEGDSHMYGKLAELERQLAECGFVRVHQSFLANMEYVDKICNYQMHLTDGSVLPVTKRRYSEVRERFAKYLKCE